MERKEAPEEMDRPSFVSREHTSPIVRGGKEKTAQEADRVIRI